MKFFTLGFTLGFSLLISSCNLSPAVDGLVSSQSANSKLTYNFSDNGCQTGEHTFFSEQQMCDGLKNEVLNNYCASRLRQVKFQADCQGRGSW